MSAEQMYLNGYADVVRLFFAVLTLDTVVLFGARYIDIGGKSLNEWYDRFGIAAVLCDVTVIMIGFMIANTLYPLIAKKFTLPLFLLLVVIVQAIHDILFYLFVIKPFPRGHNQMMDVFQDYAKENGANIIIGDAGLMLGSAAFMAVYASLSPQASSALATFVVYCLTYILYTKRQAD